MAANSCTRAIQTGLRPFLRGRRRSASMRARGMLVRSSRAMSALSAASCRRSSALSGALACGAKAASSQRRKKSSTRGLSSCISAQAPSVSSTGWSLAASSLRQSCQTVSSCTRFSASSLLRPALPPASLTPPTIARPAVTKSRTSSSISSRGGKMPSPLKDCSAALSAASLT